VCLPIGGFGTFLVAGQIELYNHVGAFRSLVNYLKSDGWNVCAVYCLDAHFVSEASKYIAGAFQVRAACQ
jgi:hypothetical protein